VNRPATRAPQFFIVLALVFGVGTVVLAAVGLIGMADALGITPTLDGISRLVFHSTALLAFEHPEGLPDELPLAWSLARMGAVVFTISTATGILLELSQLLGEVFLRLDDHVRSLAGWRPSVLLGLGWIGGPIASTLRGDRHVVYAIAVDDQGPEVAEARRVGVLVVPGDATDARTRARVPVARAREVFVATGDDTVNVELAGNLLEASRHWRRSKPLPCYVHITNPTFAETLGWQQIWAYESRQLQLVPFSYQELAARDLFFGKQGIVQDRARLPTGQEAFHVVIIGFGAMGQSVARHVARFGHFASCNRPRVTVFDADTRAFDAFLERYPAFSPPDLDLTAPPFRLAGSDRWSQPQGRPAAVRHRVDTPDAVEYAVHAEFRALPGDLAAESFTEQILDLGAPLSDGSHVRTIVVVCLDEERASFEAALRVQYAVASAIPDRPDWPDDARLPVYVHLPERGLATVLEKTDDTQWLTPEHRTRDQLLPVRAFGIRDEVASYQKVTEQSSRRQATSAQGIYALLTPVRAAREHLDFASSNLDAILHVQAKCAALGIQLRGAREPAPPGARPVLASLLGPRVDRTVRRLRRRHRDRVPRKVLERADAAVRQRIVLVGAVNRDDVDQDFVITTLDEVVAAMRSELEQHGHDPELPGMMEHNRWMGERLLKGWRQGTRDNQRRQRDSMKPWPEVAPDDRRYDAISLPRFVVQAYDEGVVAYWTGS